MQVFIRMFDGRSLQLTVPPHGAVHDIHSAIEEKEGLPLSLQHLASDGRPLNPFWTLAAAGVRDETTLDLAIRGHTTARGRCLFPTTVHLDRRAPCVQVVDALGSVPFEQLDGSISVSLTRPGVGEVFVRLLDGDLEPAPAYPSSALLRIQLPDGTEDVEPFSISTGKTAAEVVNYIFSTVSRRVPADVINHGFDLFLTRPSGEQVVLDAGADALLSPENVTVALHVRKADGATLALDLEASSSADECP